MGGGDRPRAVDACKVVVLLYSDASMRSWAVKQEIQLAGERQKVLLPLLLDRISFPDQMEFFLAGRQWIDAGGSEWLPLLLRRWPQRAFAPGRPLRCPTGTPAPRRLDWSLEGLRRLARFTDQLWPVDASAAPTPPAASRLGSGPARPRRLQEELTRGFRLGSRMRLVLESDREGHLLLLDAAGANLTACVRSFFAHDFPFLPKGRSLYPQPRSRTPSSFVLTGHRAAKNCWPSSPIGRSTRVGCRATRVPARVLTAKDVGDLLARLQALPSFYTALIALCSIPTYIARRGRYTSTGTSKK